MECESECESECASVSPIRIDDIDSFDIIGNIGNIGNIGDNGDIENYCQRERCVSISAYSSGCHLPIEDFETFHYSPLRGNFAS